MSSVTTARTDPWHCPACGRAADLAFLSAEIGLVRIAAQGPDGFALGSAGVEHEIAPLLAACECGGRFEPGRGDGEPVLASFDAAALQPVAAEGWERLAATAQLARLAEVWRPRALRASGREAELANDEVLELRLEGRLNALLLAMEQARYQGDEDAEESAHARYVEIATTYATRTLRDRPAG
jgi:hypothetical protein